MSKLSRALILLVRGYQRWLSPLLPPVCRFYPSCSHYAVEALRVHGPIRGIGLTGWRLLRCHPWHPGGIDPVPPRRPDTDPDIGTETDVAVVDLDALAPEERAPC